MRPGKLGAMLAALTIVVAACGGDDDPVGGIDDGIVDLRTTTNAQTTTTDAATTSQATTTTAPATTAAQNTTTTAGATTTVVEILTTIAAGAFDFAAGTSPRFSLEVGISTEGPDGPFTAAGVAPGPTLAVGDAYWLEFVVNNDTTSATVTDVAVEVEAQGSATTCPSEPVPPGEATTCVTEGLRAEEGAQELTFTIDVSGFRQGENFEDVIDPPLPPQLPHGGVPTSFELVLELSEADGIRLSGSTNQTAIVVDLPEISLSQPVAVDCSDTFASGFSDGSGSPQPGEPRMVAFVITQFDAGGAVTNNCSKIPIVELDFLGNADNPTQIFYVGE